MPYKIIVIKYYRILLLNFWAVEDLVTDISLLADSATPTRPAKRDSVFQVLSLPLKHTDSDALHPRLMFVGGRGLEPLTSSTSTKRSTN